MEESKSHNDHGVKYPSIDGGTAQRITIDVGNRIPPAQSTLNYGEQELAFRKEVEQEFANYRAKHPDAILDVRE